MRSGMMVLVMLVIGAAAEAQQDIQFSQYVFTGLTVNPAYAGYKEDLNLSAIYRQQWSGFPGAPRTMGITLDGLANVKEDRMGLGLELMDDKLGAEESTDLYGSYSYRIPMDQADTRRLCLGLAFGFTQYSLDGSAYQYVDAGDPSIPLIKVNTIVPDARFGVYYYTPRFYIGASVLGLFSVTGDRQILIGNSVQYASLVEAPHMYLTSGGLVNLSDEVKLKPSIMIQEDFKGPTNVDLNLFLLLDEKVWIGGSYRSGYTIFNKNNLQSGLESTDAASLMLEFYATSTLRIGYSYDFTTSGISTYQTGSHEVSIGLTFPSKKRGERIIGPRYF
jgi:type IX secretion system PorP/SprF family membrane protein